MPFPSLDIDILVAYKYFSTWKKCRVTAGVLPGMIYQSLWRCISRIIICWKFSDITLESRDLIYIRSDGRHFYFCGVASNIVKPEKLERTCLYSLADQWKPHEKFLSDPEIYGGRFNPPPLGNDVYEKSLGNGGLMRAGSSLINSIANMSYRSRILWRVDFETAKICWANGRFLSKITAQDCDQNERASAWYCLLRVNYFT